MIRKKRLPIGHLALYGWLPSPIKVWAYRVFRGYRIGKGVKLVVQGREKRILGLDIPGVRAPDHGREVFGMLCRSVVVHRGQNVSNPTTIRCETRRWT